ncbi:hypothetical protein OJF2_18140 [Aquisphaera giovannonii]|uniref:Sulfatase n=1 Tax=Aquisphaera giovannonii TaxID=406548 RepID=A0A5B9VY94_9BACT|nr:DUF1501 domain-containing protein [Aquisphaera giovannonii]QEH33313.1 hypothetical protein OJF2_18140 [Aquisphaera giovannonii]
MEPLEIAQELNRRQFLGRAGLGLGSIALGSLFGADALAADASRSGVPKGDSKGLPGLPHFAPKAKRIIYLFQSGAPSQLDLFDDKPRLRDRRGIELPESVRMGQRITTMTSGQKSLPVAPSIFKFARHGESGATFSELLPHTSRIADDLCVIRSMQTEAINHDPAITFVQTGSQLAGRPSMGAWVAYGLGSMNENLPAFVVLLSRGRTDQPLYDRLWGSGFLPTKYQGVKLRGGKEPVLYLANPAGCSAGLRRQMLDDLGSLNQIRHDQTGDPEILTRVAQYELAYRMQSSVPELTDLSGEPKSVLDRYGPDVTRPGSYAANCLLARRLAERGVRFIQLYHMGWDQHGDLPNQIRSQCRDTDQASAALVSDLKERGLLDDTLVIWGGEFGRTVYSQGTLTATDYGRDHHPRCFTIWLAGGGIRAGYTHGETDDFSYNITRDPVEVYDLNATILSLLGIDHTRLTYRFQGRDFRLTDVHGRVVKEILA